MAIEIKSNGRPFRDTEATNVRAALEKMIAAGAEVVRIDAERDDYISAAIKLRGIAHMITISGSAAAEAPKAVASGLRGELATPKQIALLRKFGHSVFPGMTKSYASATIADIMDTI